MCFLKGVPMGLSMNVQKSVVIEKPIEEVFQFISNFQNWAHWSPWICQEPECPVDISGDSSSIGHKQEWRGELIGTGNMEIQEIKGKEYVGYQLNFLKPWKSKAKAFFELKDIGGKTQVDWHLKGSIPYFIFFLRKLMIALVGMDYKRGLSMMKDYMEKGVVHTKVEKSGLVDKEAFHYIGFKANCHANDMGPKMKAGFEDLESKIQAGELPPPDFALSIYNKFDLVKEQADFISGFGYYKNPELGTKVNDMGLVEGDIPKHQAECVTHTGSYEHLGNAWATGMTLFRNKKFKKHKTIAMYEEYVNNPQDTQPADLITKVFMPIR